MRPKCFRNRVFFAPRIYLLLFIFTFLSGCVVNPYVNKEIEKPDGKTIKLLFAYGNYCGGGYPIDIGNIDPEGMIIDLESHWPPTDDLDTLCYAHDYCYDVEYGDQINCDIVFAYMMSDMREDFRSNYFGEDEKAKQSIRCASLVHDMQGAFLAKLSAKSQNAGKELHNKLANLFLGIPAAVIGVGGRVPINWFYGYPKSSDKCNLNNGHDPFFILERFEQLYRKKFKEEIGDNGFSIPRVK